MVLDLYLREQGEGHPLRSPSSRSSVEWSRPTRSAMPLRRRRVKATPAPSGSAQRSALGFDWPQWAPVRARASRCSAGWWAARSRTSPPRRFELGVLAPDARAVRAFDSLVGPEARLFEQGVGLQLQLSGAMCNDFGDVAMADATLAKSLVAETKKIDATLGGLYQGRLDLIFGRRSAIQSWAWTRVAAARAAPARRRGTRPRHQTATARRRARRA